MAGQRATPKLPLLLHNTSTGAILESPVPELHTIILDPIPQVTLPRSLRGL